MAPAFFTVVLFLFGRCLHCKFSFRLVHMTWQKNIRSASDNVCWTRERNFSIFYVPHVHMVHCWF